MSTGIIYIHARSEMRSRIAYLHCQFCYYWTFNYCRRDEFGRRRALKYYDRRVVVVTAAIVMHCIS